MAVIKEEVQHEGFTTLNPYQGLVAITANSPDELSEMLTSIKAPIKIMGFTSYGTRQVCYVLSSGFKIKKQKKNKE